MPLIGQPQSTVCADKKTPFSLHTATSNYFDLNGAIYLGPACHLNTACKAGTRYIKRWAIDLTDAGQPYLLNCALVRMKSKSYLTSGAVNASYEHINNASSLCKFLFFLSEGWGRPVLFYSSY